MLILCLVFVYSFYVRPFSISPFKSKYLTCVYFQRPNHVVAIKSITKKNLAKSQNLLSKEIKILKVRSNCVNT